MEKLHELDEEGIYDLVVVDTPPSRNALDFLDAPDHLTRFLDHRLVRMLLFPTRATMRIANVAAQSFLRTMSKVVGGEVVDDAVAFFQAFEGMEQGFRDRAQQVLELLGDPSCAFLLVTSPRRDAAEEAFYFADRLAESDIPVEAIIVNRLHPRFGDHAPESLAARAATLVEDTGEDADPTAVEAAHRLAALYRNLAELQQVADLEREYVDGLARRVAAVEGRAGEEVRVAHVPFLSDDVHDFAGLAAIAEHLFGRTESGAATTSVAPAAGG